MKSVFVATIAAIVALMLGSWMAVGAQAQGKPEIRDFMRRKLKQSQQMLEGLVRDDLDSVNTAAQEMKALSLDESWLVLQTVEYVEFSRKFRADVDALSVAAKKKNLDASTTAFNRLTSRCVECHKYVRDVRMVQK
jgi:cytochrome c556